MNRQINKTSINDCMNKQKIKENKEIEQIDKVIDLI